MGADGAVGPPELIAMKGGALTVAAVGRLKGREWKLAQADYLKRLERYTKVTLVEVKDAVGKGQPDAVAKQKEGEGLLKATEASQRIILLTESGKEMDSPELAAWLRTLIERHGRVAFLIGGPLGFSDEVTAAAHEHIALSRLTFPHEIARVLLLEQLYRAFTILNHEKYHK